MELIDEVEPLQGARDLIVDLKERGHAVVLASSAKPDEVDHYLDLLDARDLVDTWTGSGDVEETKPGARPRGGGWVKKAFGGGGRDGGLLHRGLRAGRGAPASRRSRCSPAGFSRRRAASGCRRGGRVQYGDLRSCGSESAKLP